MYVSDKDGRIFEKYENVAVCLFVCARVAEDNQ